VFLEAKENQGKSGAFHIVDSALSGLQCLCGMNPLHTLEEQACHDTSLATVALRVL
jgi:hypothetical protein